MYFPSFEAARAFHRRLLPFGDLNEGRPRVALSSRQLLEMALEQVGCEFAPAHWINPFFSICGSQGGGGASLSSKIGGRVPRVAGSFAGVPSFGEGEGGFSAASSGVSGVVASSGAGCPSDAAAGPTPAAAADAGTGGCR